MDVGADLGSGAWCEPSVLVSASELESSSLLGCLGRCLSGWWAADAWFAECVDASAVLPLTSAEAPMAESTDCWESCRDRRDNLERRPAELTSTWGCVVVVLSTSGTTKEIRRDGPQPQWGVSPLD